MKKLYWSILLIAILIIPICWVGILNVGVSLKYETENPGDCISLTSGINLCQTILYLQIAIGICIAGIIISIYKLALKGDKNSTSS